jgi:hypothetical protein
MAFYARLKKGLVQAPHYGRYIYPGDEWLKIDDKYLDMVKKDLRVEIKTQEEITVLKEEENQLITDICDGQWKQSEKRINAINDKKFLQTKLLPALEKAQKDKLISITKDRIEELTF